MSKRKTNLEFVEECNNIHNFYFDYSEVYYINAHTKIKIICPIHGIFEQTPHNHLRHGCKKCGKLISKKELILRFKKVHGNKYQYNEMCYTGMKNNIKIKCIVHGYYYQTPINHLQGKCCYKCASNSKKTLNEIILKLNKTHNNKYDYSKLEKVNVNKKVKIICPTHGEFIQILNNHLRGHGCSSCNESNGEKKIEEILLENNIKYFKQYKFKNCKDKRQLSFDFYLPYYNTCVEYDGIQHFKKCKYFGEKTFIMTKKHDMIKNNYCEKNNINLLRISYKQNIKNELKQVIKITNY